MALSCGRQMNSKIDSLKWTKDKSASANGSPFKLCSFFTTLLSIIGLSRIFFIFDFNITHFINDEHIL